MGLDAQRHSAVLHANAALASLRVKAYVQAIEHCDKACAALAQKSSKPWYLQLPNLGQSSSGLCMHARHTPKLPCHNLAPSQFRNILMNTDNAIHMQLGCYTQ